MTPETRTRDAAASTPLDALLDRYFAVVDDIETTVGRDCQEPTVDETEITDELEEAERLRTEIDQALEDARTPSLELAMADADEQNFPQKARAFTVIPPEVRVRIGLAEALKAQRAAEFLREDAIRDAQATDIRVLDDRGEPAVARLPVRRRTARGTSELDLPPVSQDEIPTRPGRPSAPIASVARPATAKPSRDDDATEIDLTPAGALVAIDERELELEPDMTSDARRVVLPVAGALYGATLFALAVAVPELALVVLALTVFAIFAYRHAIAER